MLWWQLASFCVSFSEQASLLRLGSISLHMPCNHSAVSRIRQKALKYTAAYRLRESSLLLKCAVRCAHRSVLVVVHAACLRYCGFSFLLSWLFFFFQRPRDFGEVHKTHTSTSSKLCTVYDTCVALPTKKPRAREIRCTLRVVAFVAFGCRCLCQGTLHCAVFRFVRFSAIETLASKQQQRLPCVFFAAEPR